MDKKSAEAFLIAGLLLIICAVILSIFNSFRGYPIIGLGMVRLFLGLIFSGFAMISFGTSFLSDNIVIKAFFLLVTVIWIIVCVILWTGVIL
jgi:hypothetical protein